jgi:hypothetical protein
VADVFRQYGAAYQREHRVTWQQHKVMRDIVQCRTAALGGFVVYTQFAIWLHAVRPDTSVRSTRQRPINRAGDHR